MRATCPAHLTVLDLITVIVHVEVKYFACERKKCFKSQVPVAGLYERGNVPSGSIKGEEFIVLSDYSTWLVCSCVMM
jgi:hypothetical protein